MEPENRNEMMPIQATSFFPKRCSHMLCLWGQMAGECVEEPGHCVVLNSGSAASLYLSERQFALLQIRNN